MKRYIVIIITVSLAIISACKMKQMSEPTVPGEIKISVSSVKIKPNYTQSKITSIDGFQVNSIIGIYSAIDNDDDYPVNILNPSTIKDVNAGYVQTDNSNIWSPLSNALYFEPYKEITLYSYHPYSLVQNTTTDIEQNEYLGTRVKYNIIQKQNEPEDLQMCDLMYAKCAGVSEKKVDVVLPFEHKLTKITFAIIKGQSWGATPLKLTNISLESDKIRTSAYLELIDGTVTPIESSGLNKISWEASALQPQPINNLTATNFDLIVIPGPAKGTVFTFIANGYTYQYTLKQEDEFKSGVNYVYNVKLNTIADVEPINIQASIVDWDVKSDIVIEPI